MSLRRETDTNADQAPRRPIRFDGCVDQPKFVGLIVPVGQDGLGSFQNTDVVGERHVFVIENQY